MNKIILQTFIVASLLIGCASTEKKGTFSVNKNYQELLKSEIKIPSDYKSDTDKIMSKAYWDFWNDDVQKRIDERIEKYRKATATLSLSDVDTRKPVEIKQKTHHFIFGAHIFNFNQLGKKEYNDIYKSIYGELFNSATIAFYWRTFEFERGKMRFETEYWDTEEFWNNVKHPKQMPHWRRPSTDQVVEFCEQKGLRMHGHPLIWGNRRWHHPESMIFQEFANSDEQIQIHKESLRSMYEHSRYMHDRKISKLTLDEFADKFENIAKATEQLSEIRVREIAKRYGDKIHSWDVVNESSTDFMRGNLPSKNKKITRSSYGVMNADYDLHAFALAQKYLPKKALLNINDYNTSEHYLKQIERLSELGCKIDVVGAQMHLFDPKLTLAMANGDFSDKHLEKQTPEKIEEIMGILSKAGKPIHLSEITVTAAGTSHREQMMQAIALRNLYRMWFSIENMMGITIWNTVDDCGAPGEPSLSGIFTRDMKPKPAFWTLNSLINEQWKTNTVAKVDKNGKISFRGFKGKYEISYIDKNGIRKSIEYNLK